MASIRAGACSINGCPVKLLVKNEKASMQNNNYNYKPPGHHRPVKQSYMGLVEDMDCDIVTYSYPKKKESTLYSSDEEGVKVETVAPLVVIMNF